MIEIKVSNEAKTPIYTQIANQLKDKINSGELGKGDVLQGRQALAKQLNVNINTINHAYRILENEGYIYSRRGIGSFVNIKIERKAKTALPGEIQDKLNDLKRKTLASGCTAEEFKNIIQNFLKSESEPLLPKAVFVECHEVWTNDQAIRLQNELGIEVKPVVMPDRKTNMEEVIREIKNADIVITTHVHFGEVREIAGTEKYVSPLDMHLSYELITELGEIKESRIGVPFLKPITIKRLNHWVKAVGFKIDLIPVKGKDMEGVVAKSKEFKILMVTENHVRELSQVLPSDIRILTIKSVLGEQSVQHLKESLIKLCLLPGQ
jgi:GntR family transcriptional regulator